MTNDDFLVSSRPTWKEVWKLRDEVAALRAELEALKLVPTWECKSGGLKPLTDAQYHKQPDHIKVHYTRIQTPERKVTLEE